MPLIYSVLSMLLDPAKGTSNIRFTQKPQLALGLLSFQNASICWLGLLASGFLPAARPPLVRPRTPATRRGNGGHTADSTRFAEVTARYMGLHDC